MQEAKKQEQEHFIFSPLHPSVEEKERKKQTRLYQTLSKQTKALIINLSFYKPSCFIVIDITMMIYTHTHIQTHTRRRKKSMQGRERWRECELPFETNGCTPKPSEAVSFAFSRGLHEIQIHSPRRSACSPLVTDDRSVFYY